MTQLLVDLVAVKFADIIGFRACVIISQVVSALGLILMAFLPELLPNAFVGIIISVVLYAIGSGLIVLIKKHGGRKAKEESTCSERD